MRVTYRPDRGRGNRDGENGFRLALGTGLPPDENLPAFTIPIIGHVSPGTIPSLNGNQTITITGHNFVQGSTLVFDPPTGGNIQSSADKLTFVSDNQIRYEINNLSDVGGWSVQVKNPNGEASGWAGFDVQAGPLPVGVQATWEDEGVRLDWSYYYGAESFRVFRDGLLRATIYGNESYYFDVGGREET